MDFISDRMLTLFTANLSISSFQGLCTVIGAIYAYYYFTNIIFII